MRKSILAFLAVCPVFCFGQDAGGSPHLLLTPQRLRRLERDSKRQTVRWTNLENRVQSVPDSPERGFELALYYAVTRDEKRGREAVEWALAHPCERRQRALVLDWAGGFASTDETRSLRESSCPIREESQPEALRDALFVGAAAGRIKNLDETAKRAVLESIERDGFENARELYAACEFLDGARTALEVELREDAPQFFALLPTEFLLSLKPETVEHPDWMSHIAALALVSLDPNLPASQYLQGWAIEDRQMVREGPGVAYEFLWGNPYLPGVGYQNLDPWVYDDAGRLFARSDWSEKACWVRITTHGVDDGNCAPDWRQNPTKFGQMTLIPMSASCVTLPYRNKNETAIVWQLRPHEKLSYVEQKKKETAEVDPAGMWRVPVSVGGKVCVAR